MIKTAADVKEEIETKMKEELQQIKIKKDIATKLKSKIKVDVSDKKKKGIKSKSPVLKVKEKEKAPVKPVTPPPPPEPKAEFKITNIIGGNQGLIGDVEEWPT